MIQHKIHIYKEKIMNQRRMRIGSALLTGLALLVFAACEQPSNSDTSPQPAKATVEDIVIDGVVGYAITPQDVVITIARQSLRVAIEADADLSDWIGNLPEGLNAKAAALAPKDATSVTLTVSGTPEATLEQELTIGIPELVLVDYKALPVDTNDNAKFDIIEAKARVSDVTITGIQDAAISNTYTTITLYADSLKDSISINTDLSAWFTNLPAGLTAKARYAVSVTSVPPQKIEVTISGTPTGTGRADLDITIPGSFLAAGQPLTIYKHDKAYFSIFEAGARVASIGDVTINGVTNFRDATTSSGEPKFIWEREIAITPKDVLITLTNDSWSSPIAADADLSIWITNLPSGLSAKAKTAAPAGGATLTITVSGTPTVNAVAAGGNSGATTLENLATKAPLAITIPNAALDRSGNLDATENAGAKFYIASPIAALPRKTTATTRFDTTVLGTKGSSVSAVDVVITVTNDTKAASYTFTENTTSASSWFTNLPAGLSAVVKSITGDTNAVITLTVSGTPVDGIADYMKIVIPAEVLACGMPVEVRPEITARYVIAETAMTSVIAKEMASITGGNVTTTPLWEHDGGIDSTHGYTREPGPFYITTSPLEVATGKIWDNPAPVVVPSFKIGKYQVTQGLWYEVNAWAQNNGYTLAVVSEPAETWKFLPQDTISLQTIVVWCNAYSQKEGKTLVYYTDEECTTPIKATTSSSSFASVHVKAGANGYQVPTPTLWEYAARGGSTTSPQWNYKWPGTDSETETVQYMWVDPLRLYDAYYNTVPVGMMKPNGAGIYDMAGNLHDYTFRSDSFDASQFVHRGGAFNRDASRSAFNGEREERAWTGNRDVTGLRVVSDVVWP
jgi:formylglycine-generating enzyme required for sulfatase activity